jgi:hypothetical protein
MVIFEQAIILLSGGFTVWKCKKRVSGKLSSGRFMTQNDTPEIALRIRIKSLPIPGEFDEFDLRPYRIGGTYELPLRLASLLILGGYAERAGSSTLAEAADFGRPTFPLRNSKR